MAACPNCHETNPEIGGACPRCEGFHYVPEESIEDAATDPMIGRMTANKYIVLGLISEGGMGAVYRALQLPVEREVAFKVLRTELKDSDNGRDRFIREARAVSRLNHANIITLYDFGFDSGKHPYMVMEYAPGKSLAKWLKTEQVTTERILRVTAQILSALTEAHSHGIVHRDLKPENMIISPKGTDPDRVKLLDFGIARMINEGSTRGITREGEVFGTPHYMAPEQAQGRKDIGPPADVYAVGIMLWEMLCGECPFDAPTPLAVLFMHINDPIPPLVARPGVDILAGLEHVVQRATAKDPMNRYQSASEMMSDIGQIFAGSAVHHNILFSGVSAEFVMGDTVLPGTVPPGIGSGVHSNTPVPTRNPYFTPTNSNMGAAVGINDPDPSYNTTAPNVVAPLLDPGPAYDEEPPPPSNAKLGAIAAVLFFAAFAIVGAIVVSQMGNDAGAEDAVVQAPVGDAPVADGPAAEIATKEDPFDIVMEPIVAEKVDVVVNDEPIVPDEPVELVKVEVKPKPKEEPAAIAKPKPKAEPKPKPKEEPKPKPKEEPKPKAEPEAGPEKFKRAPVKFKPAGN